MKKTKLIACALVVAIMLMGAGYAYWQQELTIKSTVDTGDLKVEFVPLLLDLDGSLILDDYGDYDNQIPIDDNYMNVYLDFDSDKLECSFKDIYPGAGGFLRFRIANTGTVPAKVTNLEPIITGGTEDQLDKFDYYVRSLRIYTPKSIEIPYFDWNNWEWVTANYTWTDVNLQGGYIYAETFDEFKAKLLDRLDDRTLEPYAFFEINGEGSGYDIVLSPDIDDEDSMEDLTEENGNGLGFDLNIEFTQGE